MQEQLETVEIDVKKRIYKVNGTDISETCTRFQLLFEDGQWSLETVENKSYAISDHAN